MKQLSSTIIGLIAASCLGFRPIKREVSDSRKVPARSQSKGFGTGGAGRGGIYSKIERGDRRAKREQVLALAELLHADPDELLNLWLADQVCSVIGNEKQVETVLSIVAENIVEYGTK